MALSLMANTTEGVEARNEKQLRERRRAYAELIAPLEATLLRAAGRFCPGQYDLAQDLVQETLVRGYEAFLDGRFQEGTNARAWLLTILTNCFLLDKRRNRRMANLDMDTLIASASHTLTALQAPRTEQPDTALFAGVLDEPLECALALLSDDLRIAVILADIEELSYAEVAATLDIPIGTVRSRLFRARQQLYASLQDYAQEHRRTEIK